ncbi:hypothetical protein BH23BAC1_BH23BAC1_32290 [soil metagenome]
MHKILYYFIFIVILSACRQNENVQTPEYILRFGHLANENNIWHKAALKFAGEVHQRSKGRIEVKIYTNEQLGNEMEW